MIALLGSLKRAGLAIAVQDFLCKKDVAGAAIEQLKVREGRYGLLS